MALIGVDWGSSNLRAYRFGPDGEVVDRRESHCGAARLKRPEFAGVLAETLEDWIEADTLVILAGMVGARAGWHEAAYLPCPANPEDLAGAALRVEDAPVRCYIVPGLSARSANGVANVMRGEETQILGSHISDGTIVLPGTHSKWAQVGGGRITGFTTVMTGEMYALLRNQSLLGQLAEGDATDEGAFALGAQRALDDPAGALPLLFSARAEVLLGSLSPQSVASYLSGLLIGGEVAALRERARDGVMLICSAELAALYRVVLALAGVADVRVLDGADAVAQGLWRIGGLLK
jgi:2-dehydro-3-deoxygalactonokinase